MTVEDKARFLDACPHLLDDVTARVLPLAEDQQGSISLRDGEPAFDGRQRWAAAWSTPTRSVSHLIDLVNERFGTDFNQADQLFFDQIVEAAMADDGLRKAAAVNPGDKFALVFKHLIENLFVERMDQNEEIFVRFMNDLQFQKVVTAWMASEAYKRLRSDVAGERLEHRPMAVPPKRGHSCGSSNRAPRTAT